LYSTARTWLNLQDEAISFSYQDAKGDFGTVENPTRIESLLNAYPEEKRGDSLHREG